MICRDYMWGIGRQGYRCADCKMCVHKKCHRAVRQPCGEVGDLRFTPLMACGGGPYVVIEPFNC